MSSSGVPSIDPTMLTRTVRRAVGRERVELGEWSCEPLHAGFSGAGVYRCSGTGQRVPAERVMGQAVPWSLVLKISCPPSSAVEGGAGDDPSAFYYWKRGALAYQSGVLADLPRGVAAARWFGVEEQTEGCFWLWLEDIRESGPARWPLAQYVAAARHLGAFNGAYLTGRPMPAVSWLATRWVRSWLTPFASRNGMLEDASTWQHPLIRAAYPASVPARLQRLWDDREALLSALARLPRTLCHFDAWRTNLFARSSAEGQEETVAIDWAFAGIGAVGEEIGTLVWASLALFELEPEEARVLEPLVFEGYLAGLREAGWRGQRRGYPRSGSWGRQARFGYVASAALRFGLPALWHLRMAVDETEGAAMEQRLGRPVDELLKQWAELTGAMLDLADEARVLLPLIAA